jgi:hypothetical protein
MMFKLFSLGSFSSPKILILIGLTIDTLVRQALQHMLKNMDVVEFSIATSFGGNQGMENGGDMSVDT